MSASDREELASDEEDLPEKEYTAGILDDIETLEIIVFSADM